jgi:hypothetical protein
VQSPSTVVTLVFTLTVILLRSPASTSLVPHQMRRCFVMLESALRPEKERLRILVVGAGPTGALTAARLREVYPAASITVLDKARAPGGRMHTHHASGAGRGSSVDTGAQYISSLPLQKSSAWNARLLEAGVLQPLSGSIVTPRLPPADLRNLVSPTGMASIVSYILDQSKAAYIPLSKLLSLDMGDTDGDAAAVAAAAAPTVAPGEADDAVVRWVATVEGGGLQHLAAPPSPPPAAVAASSGDDDAENDADGNAVDADSSTAAPASVSAAPAPLPSATAAVASIREDGGDEVEAQAHKTPSFSDLLLSSLAQPKAAAAGGSTTQAVAAAGALPSSAAAAAAAAAAASSPPRASSLVTLGAAAAAALSSHTSPSAAPSSSSASFDAVVLTCPVPQALAIGGDLPALITGSEVSAALAAVSYSSRYSLAVFFGPGDWGAVAEAVPYSGRYVGSHEDDVIRYIGFDSAKRGRARPAPAQHQQQRQKQHVDEEGDSRAGTASAPPPHCGSGGGGEEPCPALLVHTGVDFGRLYVKTDPSLVQPVILEHLRRLHPNLPTPVEMHCHRWLYSQVVRSYDGPEPFEGVLASPDSSSAIRRGTLDESHGHSSGGHAVRHVGALLLVDDPPLVLAGDGFTASHFDGCVESAERVRACVQAWDGSPLCHFWPWHLPPSLPPFLLQAAQLVVQALAKRTVPPVAALHK